MRRVWGFATAIALLLAMPLAGVAQAALSVPTPHYYWDVGDNGSPDPNAYTIRTAGDNSYWTAGREARITAAASEWVTDTVWNPLVNLSAAPANCFLDVACHGVWIDGTQPPPECGGAFQAGDLALNCFLTTNRVDAEGTPYKDISDSNIYFFTAGPGHPTFTYTAAGSVDDNIYDFQGVLTHEMGHAIYLYDLGLPGRPACAPGGTLETMCGVVPKGWQSTQQRSLVADDKTSANIVY